MSIERRFSVAPVRLRGDVASNAVAGYGAVFNKLSGDLGGFVERIAVGAFDSVLGDDVRALFNHDSNLILARSKNGRGTLRIGIDDTGLWYQFAAPDTSYGRDLLESIRRGDVDQSSFGFTVAKDEWREVNGIPQRTILKLARLTDVSPCVFPAYPDTSVALAGLRAFRAGRGASTGLAPIPSIWAARMGLLK
jgi:uncharacterized protein